MPLLVPAGDQISLSAALLLWHGSGSWQLPVRFARIAGHRGAQLGGVVKVRNLVYGGWARAIVLDPTQGFKLHVYEDGRWNEAPALSAATPQEGLRLGDR